MYVLAALASMLATYYNELRSRWSPRARGEGWWPIIRLLGPQVFLETSGKSERKICGISRRLAEEIGGRGPLVSAPRRFVHTRPRAHTRCWGAPASRRGLRRRGAAIAMISAKAGGARSRERLWRSTRLAL